MLIFIISISCLFQLCTACIALYTIKLTGKKLSWILIASATLLMMVRRIIPLIYLILGTECITTLENESVGLLLSILIFFGILGIRNIFIEWNLFSQKIMDLVSEKNIILKEVHHRIKNNITSIQSILHLQSALVKDTDCQNILQDAISRVSNMRIIYDKLLATDDYKELSVKHYLEDLISAVINIYPDKDKVRIETDIDDFLLNVKKLFPLGTAINELITNSMKYAFMEKSSGIINISLKRHASEIQLSVHDNGKGIPENFYKDDSSGFGIMLITMLTDQLGGTCTFENDNGAKCVIRFKV